PACRSRDTRRCRRTGRTALTALEFAFVEFGHDADARLPDPGEHASPDRAAAAPGLFGRELPAILPVGHARLFDQLSFEVEDMDPLVGDNGHQVRRIVGPREAGIIQVLAREGDVAVEDEFVSPEVPDLEAFLVVPEANPRHLRVPG